MKTILLIAALCLLLNEKTKAQTAVDLPAVADNTMYSESTNSNGVGPNFFLGKTNSGNIRRALIKFDVSGIPSGSTITSVIMTLSCTQAAGGSTNVTLHRVTADWGEGTSNAGGSGGNGTGSTNNDATWACSFADGAGGCNTAWTTSGGDYSGITSATTAVNAASNTYDWNDAQMVTDVQAWVDGTSSNYGWVILGDETTNQTAKRMGSRENGTPADRPKCHIEYNPPLPVTLISFGATKINSSVELKWITASEFNSSYFSVERSVDGIHFISIGKKTAAGTSNLENKYYFTDNSPSAAINYYRLHEVDIDRSNHYSNTILIEGNDNLAAVQLNPTIITNEVLLQSAIDLMGKKYSISNETGVVISSGILSGKTISADQLPAGFYFLTIEETAGGISVLRFVKQ